MDPAALPGPLSVYQSTVATKEDTFGLINSLLGDLMGTGDFAPAWDDLWPRLQRIEKELVTSIFPGLAGLFDRKTFQEPLDECRDQSWFKRYDGTVATHDASIRRVGMRLSKGHSRCLQPGNTLSSTCGDHLHIYASQSTTENARTCRGRGRAPRVRQNLGRAMCPRAELTEVGMAQATKAHRDWLDEGKPEAPLAGGLPVVQLTACR